MVVMLAYWVAMMSLLLNSTEVVATATLTYTLGNNLVGTPCQSVEMICRATNLSSFSWDLIAGLRTSIRELPPTFQVPYFDQFQASQNGISITLIEYDNTTLPSGTFSVTSVLNATLRQLVNGRYSEFNCGVRDGTRSQGVDIASLTRRITDIPPPTLDCFYTSYFQNAEPEEVFLDWSPSFTSQHDVAQYRVLVSPDPSSCSSGQVNTSRVYNCSGLEADVDYTIMVKAISECRHHDEGRTTMLSTQDFALEGLQGITGVKALANRRLSVVTVNWTEERPSLVCVLQFEYTVTLEDSSGEALEEKEFASARCRARACTVTFSVARPDEDYSVNITAYNALGDTTSRQVRVIKDPSINSMPNDNQNSGSSTAFSATILFVLQGTLMTLKINT